MTISPRSEAGPAAMLVLDPYVLERFQADRLVDKLGDVAGRHVLLDCRAVSAATAEFADQLVARLFEDKRIAGAGASCGHGELWRGIERALATRGLSGRIVGVPIRDLYVRGLRKVS